jgi:hypothetical protein
MPKPIINGYTGSIRQRTRTQYDPSQGETTTHEWESAGDNLGGEANTCKSLGMSYDLTRTGYRSRLIATESRNNFIQEQALERWELLSNQNMLDIREHPNSVAIGQANLARVLKDIKKHENGQTVDTSSYTSAQLRLFNLMLRGVTHYPVWNWTVRYTANVSNTYQQFTAANSGVGTIITHADMKNSVPAGRMRSTLNAIPELDDTDDMTWGWLKTSVTEVVAARNRVDISSEAVLAQWSTFLYT